MKTKLVIGHELRSEIDNNRIESRQSDFRKRLREELNHAGRGSYVLEIHSFPEKKLGPMDVYQLDTYPRSSVSIALEPVIPFFEGSPVNDISVEMKTNYPQIPHTLIEFYEYMKQEDLTRISATIATAVQWLLWPIQ